MAPATVQRCRAGPARHSPAVGALYAALSSAPTCRTVASMTSGLVTLPSRKLGWRHVLGGRRQSGGVAPKALPIRVAVQQCDTFGSYPAPF